MTRTSVQCAGSMAAGMLAVSWLAFGCGSRYEPITGDPDTVQSITHCVSNADCESSQICAGGVCQDACASDADCGTEQLCRSGVCRDSTGTQPCTHTSECPVSEFCNLASQQCVECLTDDHCETGLYCRQNNTCGTDPSECASDEDCTGLRCDVTSRQCVQCVSSSDCPPGQMCRNHGCVGEGPPACTSNADCVAYGKICEMSTGQCRNCTSDGECGFGRMCSTGTCTNAGDGGGGSGGGGGLGSACSSHSECGEGACYLGVCTACFADFMCFDLLGALAGEVMICDIATGMCIPPECTSAYDCPAQQGCYGGHCGSCMDDSECRSGEVCANGACTVPTPAVECTRNEDCTGGRVCVASACVDCTGSHECNADLECVSGRCQSGAAATAGDEASFGDTCTGAADDCGDGLVCLGNGMTGMCSRTCIGSGQGNGADCPSGTACANFDAGALDGLSLCSAPDMLPADYPGQPFDLAPGASCAAGNGCQTSLCFEEDLTCARSCIADRDCLVGEVCWAASSAEGEMLGLHLCIPSDLTTYKAVGADCASGPECNSGLCAGRCPDGAACNQASDCTSGVCSGTCIAHCRSNADCATAEPPMTTDLDESCSAWPTRIDASGFGGWVTGCLPRYFDGTEPDGTPCASHEVCLSDWCIEGTCTTLCGITADCIGALDGRHCLPITFTDDQGNAVTSLAFCL